jgi:hypothetical protein
MVGPSPHLDVAMMRTGVPFQPMGVPSRRLGRLLQPLGVPEPRPHVPFQLLGVPSQPPVVAARPLGAPKPPMGCPLLRLLIRPPIARTSIQALRRESRNPQNSRNIAAGLPIGRNASHRAGQAQPFQEHGFLRTQARGGGIDSLARPWCPTLSRPLRPD